MKKDGRLLTELVYGTIARQQLLDYYLQPFVAKAKKLKIGCVCCSNYRFINYCI